MPDRETIAVLGAGSMMGRPMAANLARAGFPVRAWNRSRAKAEPLAREGAEICDTPAQAADGAGIVLTMLADAEVVLAAMHDALQVACERTLWLQMSTIGDAGTDRCRGLAGDRGLEFVDAPVLGTTAPAQQGELVILASGPEAARPRVQPLFDVLGRRTMWIGEAGAGSRLKLATNQWVLTVVEGGAEALALAEGLGLDPQLVLDAISGGPLDLPYLQLKGKAMIERDFAPAFRLALAAKDAGLMAAAAERHGLDLPVLEAIRTRLEQGAAEHPDEDMSATFLTSLPAVARS